MRSTLFVNKREGFLHPVNIIYILLVCLFFYMPVWSQTPTNSAVDSVNRKFRHQVEIGYRPAWIIPPDPAYLKHYNADLPVGFSQSGHIKYAFALPDGSLGGQIYPHTHQGVGIAVYDFGNRRELGIPIAAYLFQRSEIIKIAPHVSLDYEWNFGISAGWVPYHPENNPNNIIVGSKVNAYINLGTDLRWQLSPRLSVSGGIDLTHFSNGNTEYPNAGFNTTGIRGGLIYDVSGSGTQHPKTDPLEIIEFPRHFSYDLVVFGSWRRKGVDFFGRQVPSPYKYPVVGAYFAPMYNWGYRLRTGFSMDAIYDGSANVYTEDYIVGTDQLFFKPHWQKQVALGVSARAEYVMPIFTIGLGIGTNLLHKGGDFNGTYQALSLKIRSSRSSFIHIGYNLKDFHDPNYLMLGLGYRFNNRAPSLL